MFPFSRTVEVLVMLSSLLLLRCCLTSTKYHIKTVANKDVLQPQMLHLCNSVRGMIVCDYYSRNRLDVLDIYSKLLDYTNHPLTCHGVSTTIKVYSALLQFCCVLLSDTWILRVHVRS